MGVEPPHSGPAEQSGANMGVDKPVVHKAAGRADMEDRNSDFDNTKKNLLFHISRYLGNAEFFR